MARTEKAKGISLTSKILLLLLVVFATASGMTIYLSHMDEKQLAFELAKKSLTDENGRYFDSLNTLMLTGAMEEREVLREKMLRSEGVVEMRVVRGEAVREQFGAGNASEQIADELDRRALAGEEVIAEGKSVQGRTLTVALPYRATRNTRGVDCLQCHQVADGTINGAIRITVSLAATDAELDKALYRSIGINGSVLLIALILFAWLLRSMVVKPVEALRDSALRIIDGDLDSAIVSHSQDSIGQLAMAMEDMRQHLQQAERERETTHAEQEQQRQRQQQMVAEMEQNMASGFEAGIGKLIEQLEREARHILQASSQFAALADQVRNRAQSAVDGVEGGSHNISMTAAATEEMSASIAEVSRQTGEMRSISQHASEQAQQTNQTVTRLAEAAESIGSILTTISKIAAQTNLLALNASIEAARAGHAGLGFAVVANEVKDLSQQTSRATGEIGQQIARMQQQCREAVDAIHRIGTTIGEINHKNHAVAEAMEQQAQATGEISGNAQSAHMGMEQVQIAASEVAVAADSVRSAASESTALCQSMLTQVELVRLEVDRFLTGLRNGKA